MRTVAVLLGIVATSGCSGLLEVDNPNSVKQEDLGNPTAAAAIANGSLALLAQATSWLLLDNASATDEIKWVGSRDAYNELNKGNITDPNNEFSDATWPIITESRYMADEAVSRLKAFNDAGKLTDKTILARAYLYAGITYTSIPDHFDDFVISTPSTPAAPIGPTAMISLYDTAIQNLTAGLAIIQTTPNAEIERQLLAARTRARFQKSLWAKVNPRGTIAANPLVSDAAAEADGQLFLTKTADVNWRYRFIYSASTVTSNIGAWLNERLEQRIGDQYVVPTSNDKKVASVKFKDLIETTKVPAFLNTTILEFVGARQFTPITALSAREVRSMLAELALARGSETDAATHINAIRTADGLAAWVPGGAGMPTAIDMLKHTRRVNLFLQVGRRLTDHYRFKENSQYWVAGSEAIREPGSFFPIARQERESNCKIAGGC